MDFTILIFIFFVVSILQPIIRQKMIESARTRLFREMEQKRGSRVISLIHRQERLSFLGFPLARYIDIDDSEDVLRAIKLTDPSVPIDLVLHTPGGLVLASEQIANALCRHPAKVTVFVPHYAMSGGTLIALSADEIIMDENAVLGPVDPQVGGSPAASILTILEQKPIENISDETLIHADVARKAIRQVKDTIKQIVSERRTPEEAENLAEILASGRWTHDYPISVDEARQLGLPITTQVPEEVYKIMRLFPQSAARRPSVEFIPLPYPIRQPGRERPREAGEGS